MVYKRLRDHGNMVSEFFIRKIYNDCYGETESIVMKCRLLFLLSFGVSTEALIFYQNLKGEKEMNQRQYRIRKAVF